MQINQTDLLNIDRELASRSLSEFIKMSWPMVEAETYIHGWHMDAMCEHLEACASGQIIRLLINVPPGTSKSMTTGVFFPAWLWGAHGKPQTKFISASFSQDNAVRDNTKTRDLIKDPWFQDRWKVGLKGDQNEKKLFQNDAMGFRQCSSVTGMTGKRGNFVLWDDPLNPEMARSDTERETANRIFQETLPLRVISPKFSVIIIIMQRLHEDDVSGHIIANDYGYEHLMLPMEFEPNRKCYTSIGFEDPRTYDGELLFEKRFPRDVVDRDKKVLGSYAAAGQLQQSPAPRGGGMFQKKDFEIVAASPSGCQWVRGWDLAGSDEETSAWTAGVLIGKSPNGTYYIQDATRIQGTSGKVDKLLKNTATQDDAAYQNMLGSIPQDPGSSGKDRARYLIKHLAGHNYRKSPESGEKVARAEPMSAQAEAGNIKIVKGDWNKDFLDEITVFPNSKFKDQVDAATRAFNLLATGPEPFSWSVGGKTIKGG